MIAKFQRDTFLINLLALALTMCLPITSEPQEMVDSKFLFGSGSKTAQTLRSKGYIASDHYIKVQDNQYTLNLVRVTNPLINRGRSGLPGKEPIVFIHGLILNAIGFFYFDEGVGPKDFSSYNVSSMSIDELNNLLEDEPGSRSLVFTVLNFGHEVWLVNRRNVRDTLKANSNFFRTNSSATTIDNENHDHDDETDAGNLGGESDRILNSIHDRGQHRYWNYSLDEQARYDIPETIDYVLGKSGRGNLSIVGHSAGSALALLSLTNYPELADKINKAILWAPAMDLPYRIKHPLGIPLVELLPILSRIEAPLFPEHYMPPIEGIVSLGCETEVLRQLLCEPISDLILGLGGSQLKLEKLTPQNEWLNLIPSFELAQFLQSVERSTLHRYDYFDVSKNMNAYGKLKPPKYNLTRIKLKTMSFWVGDTDSLVSEEDTDFTMRQIAVPNNSKISRSKFRWNDTL